ncbi:MAG: alpha/beta hydrolase [Chloroflexi bacterium]|nr:alpha/beta hydrolase [Chloroflexota bacterium]
MVSRPQAIGQEKIITTGGVDVALTEFPLSGRPPVVLLHGLGSRGQSWWPVIDALAERFHLYQVDLRGHGASGKPANGYRIEDYATDLGAVIDALDLESPRIVGHSLGALVTLFWASERPARAAALVVEDPSLRTPPNILEAFDGWQQLAALTPAEAAAWYHQQYPDWSDEDCLRRAETITSTVPGVFAELRAEAREALANGTTDRTHILAAVQSPALLVHGNSELGSMVAPEDVERFVQIMPRGRAMAIPDAGHSLHRDATDAFLAAVIPFLEGEGWD